MRDTATLVCETRHDGAAASSSLNPADPETRAIAQRLFAVVETLPIVSPHGHTQASWFARNERRALVDVLVAHAAQAQPPVSTAKILAMKP